MKSIYFLKSWPILPRQFISINLLLRKLGQSQLETLASSTQKLEKSLTEIIFNLIPKHFLLSPEGPSGFPSIRLRWQTNSLTSNQIKPSLKLLKNQQNYFQSLIFPDYKSCTIMLSTGIKCEIAKSS